MTNTISDNTKKAFAQTPRRSPRRTAKTQALNVLAERRDTRKYNRGICTAPKKRWKAKKQRSIAAEVTPSKSLPSLASSPNVIARVEKDVSHSNDTTVKPEESENQKNENSENPSNSASQEPPLKPMILADINLDGAFANSNDDREISHIQSLRSLKVTTYPGAPFTRNLPFPLKLYHMVQLSSVETPSICRWSNDGSSIELNSKNPALTKILRRHFNHSRWLSFSRQLNNYGFSSAFHEQVANLKIIKHPHFHRDIPDPIMLVKLLPYLPGKRLREKREKKKKKTKVICEPIEKKKSKKTISKCEKKIISEVQSAESEEKTKKMMMKKMNRKREKNIVPGVSTRKTKKPRRVLAPKSSNRKSIANTVTPLTTSKSTTAELKITPPRTVTARIPKKSKSNASQGGGKDIKTPNNSFKTPSPRYRHVNSHYMSSPPPLSHYLQPKNMDPEAGNGVAKDAAKNSIPSSLLTVDFVMSPSALINHNIERTPRTSNLSSSQSSPMSQDGFKMLSWAAQAVESPQKTMGRRIHTPDGMTSVRFMEAMDCSPIVPPTTKRKGSLATAISECCPPSSESNGSSPFPFRDDREDNVYELELLRNCLEDVFVANSNGNASSGGSV